MGVFEVHLSMGVCLSVWLFVCVPVFGFLYVCRVALADFVCECSVADFPLFLFLIFQFRSFVLFDLVT